MISSFSSGGFDPSQYSEHQAVNPAVNSTSLTTLMSKTGKGMLEEALMATGLAPLTTGYYQPGTTATTTTIAPELVITIDGTVVFDIVDNFVGASAAAVRALIMSDDFKPAMYSSSYAIGGVITGLENLLGGYILATSTSVNGLTAEAFPNSAQVSQPRASNTVIVTEQPIYFNQSLLVQVKGVASAGNITAFAKARY
jgi:hypothetical protein